MDVILDMNNYLKEQQKSFSTYLQGLLKVSSTIVMMALVVGCGGGSGGDSDGTVFPRELQRPINENPVTPSTDLGENPLTQLYGRILFIHSFYGSDTSYIYDGEFGPEDLIGDDLDSFFLIDTFDVVKTEGENGEFEAYRPQEMSCTYVEVSRKYYCNVFFESGSSDHFWFEALVDNASYGTYTYCLSDQSVDACVDDIFNDPSGGVLVSKLSSLAASSISIAKLDSAKESRTGGSIVPYLEYENQGKSQSISNRSFINPEVYSSLKAAFEANKLKLAR